MTPSERRFPRELLLVLAATALTFAVTVRFPFMGWDDPRYVTINPLVVHPLSAGWKTLLTTPELGYPQAVTVLSYALNRLVFGMSPWSFHLVNVAIHLVNVGLAWRIASTLGLSDRESSVAAMIVGLHPLVVEPVCWITARKDLLAAGFVLSAIALVTRGPRDAAFPGARVWIAATLLCLAGIGAKPSAAIAPALVWVVARCARPHWSVRRLALAVAPLAVMGGALLVVEGRAVVDVHSRSPSETVLDVLGAFTMQLGHVLWPVDLVTSYGRYDGDPSTPAMALALCALVATVVVVVRLDRSSAGFAGLAFAIIAYGPVSGVLAVNRWSADSYMYLPLVGLSIAGVAAARAWVPPRLSRVASIAVMALGLTWMIDSFALASNWSSPEGVWLAEIDRYPDNPVAYTELARTFAWEQKHAQAVAAFLDLDQRAPDFEFARDERADVLLEVGRVDRAKALLEKGIETRDRACARSYWFGVISGQIRVSRTEADARDLKASLDLVGDAMRAQIRDRSVWEHIAGLLRSAGLERDAARAAEQAASLPL